jgi:hypothetical protein
MGALLTFFIVFSTQDVSWWRVEQLPRGADIQVVVDSGASYRGHLSSVDARTIQLDLSSRAVALDRAHVRRLSLNRGTHHKRRNVILGLMLGGIAGAAVHQAGCGNTGPGCAESAPVGFYPGAAAGMIVGAAVPSGDWETIYLVVGAAGREVDARAQRRRDIEGWQGG